MIKFAVDAPTQTTQVVNQQFVVLDQAKRLLAFRPPIPLLIFAASLTLYWLTRTHLNTFDAVAYANQIGLAAQTGKLRPLFHPHHLLFNALGYGLWQCVRAMGLSCGPLIVTQSLNAVLGAIGLGIYHAALRRLSPVGGLLPLLITLGLAGSFGYWICATDGRVNMPSVVLLMAAFLALLRLREKSGWKRAAWAGILAGAAVVFHQSAGLFAPVGVASLLLLEPDLRRYLKLLSAYGMAWMAAVLVPYALVSVFALHLHSLAAFRHWANSYAEVGWWWDFHILHNLHLDLFGLRHAVFVEPLGRAALAQTPLHALGTAALVLEWLLYAGALTGLAASALVIALALPRLRRSSDWPVAAPCLLWLGLYAAFFTVWCPGAFVFWVPALPPLGVLLLLALRHVPLFGRHTGLALGGWVAVYAALNLLAGIAPYLKPVAGISQRVAADILANTPRRSLVLVAGVGDDAQCEVDIPYFANRPVLSLHQVLTHAHDFGEARTAVQTSLARAFGAGRHVYLLDQPWENPRTVTALHHQSQEITPAALRSLFAPYHPLPVWRGPCGVVYQLSAASPEGRIISLARRMKRVTSQMPAAIGATPSRSIACNGSPSAAQLITRPTGGIRKCSALAAEAVWRRSSANHSSSEPIEITATNHTIISQKSGLAQGISAGFSLASPAPPSTIPAATCCMPTVAARLDDGAIRLKASVPMVIAASEPNSRMMPVRSSPIAMRLRTTSTAPASPSARPITLRGPSRSCSSGAATAATMIGLRLAMIVATPADARCMPNQANPW